MQRANQLLAVLIAAILSMSALASINIPATIAFPAFAEEHEDDESDDNSGSGSGSNDSDESEDESEDEEHDDAMEDESDDSDESGDDDSHDESEDEDDNSGHGSDDSDDSEDEAEDEYDDESEDESESEHEDESEDEMEDQHDESKTKLKVEDDGVEVEVERKNLELADGLYNATFSCTDPSVSKGFEDALEVEDGEGDFEAHFALEAGTYSGCEVTVDEPEMTLASFDAFTVSAESEDEHDDESEDDNEHGKRVEDHRRETAENAESKVHEIRERITNAEPASPGMVAPGLNYTLIAAGMTDEESVQDASVDLKMLSWKSTPAIAILAVVGGEVEVGDTDYTVVIGYALYSLKHDVVRVNALAVDEASGDIVRVTLRGDAAEGIGFPDAAGESVELAFEGNSGPQKNEIADIKVSLSGALEVA